MPAAASILELAGASYRFGVDLAVEEIDLCLHEGDRLVLVGPNGGGKSTLVRLILGLIEPTRGHRQVHREVRYGYVPQFPTFDRQFPMRVAEMVLEGRLSDRRWMRSYSAEDHAAVDAMLDRLDLGDLRAAYLAELSGGELKRALIARALVARPTLLVLDEPSASLDESSRRSLWSLLAGLPAECAVILSTHDVAPDTFVPTRAALVDRRLAPLEIDGLHQHPLLCGHAHG